MPLELKETRLPGVGVKWTLHPASGSRVTVIQHNDGKAQVLNEVEGGVTVAVIKS